MFAVIVVGILVVVIIIFISMTHNDLIARTDFDPNWLNYNNSTFRFGIQYSSDWEVIDGFNNVRFVSPDMLSQLTISVQPSNQCVRLDALQQYSVNYFKSSLTGFRLIELSPIMVDNNFALKLVYAYNTSGIINKVISINTISGLEMYNIQFAANLEKYASVEPILQTMLDSFRLRT